jgi:hypothetical protein
VNPSDRFQSKLRKADVTKMGEAGANNGLSAVTAAAPIHSLYIGASAPPRHELKDIAGIATTFGPNTLESFRVWTDENPVGEIPGRA